MVRKILFISLLLVFSNAATLTDVLDRKVEVKDRVEKFTTEVWSGLRKGMDLTFQRRVKEMTARAIAL